MKYLGLDKKGYTLLGAEGISKLRTDIMWKKSPKWIRDQMRQAEAVLDERQRQSLREIMLREGPSQHKWIEKDDCK